MSLPNAFAVLLIATIGLLCWLSSGPARAHAATVKPEPRAFQTSDAEYQLSAVRDLHARWVDRIEALRQAEASETVIMALDRCADELQVTLLRFDLPAIGEIERKP